VQQASGLLANTRADAATLESAISKAMHRLDVLVGAQPGSLEIELSALDSLPATTPIVPVGLPSELLLRRPDVQRAERQFAAATAKIGVAKSDLFPKFFLTGAAGFESVSASDWFTSGSKFWSIGPTVQWRIFDAGRIRSNIKVQNARQEQALAVYEKTALTAFQDVEDSLVSYAKEQIRRKSLVEAVSANESSLDLAQKLYSNGLTGFLNVLDAERSLYRAQDLLAQSDQVVASNLVGLYKSLGGGWETFEPTQTLANRL
jgi:NodT family efflux transporter outer membrane factor (OMF) lipoprotein